MLNENESTVLNIIKYILDTDSDVSETSKKSEEPSIAVSDWSALYEELRLQSLLPFAYPWAKQSCVPEDIFSKLTNQFAAQSYNWYRYMEEQKKLLDLLARNGYPAVVIKGCSNGINYPQPQLRVSTDIDFLVCWEDYDPIYEFLIGSGYTLSGKKTAGKHHVAFRKNNIVLEMHKRPGGTRITGKYANQELIDFFQQGLTEREIVRCVKYDIPVLPALQTAMVLLLHTEQHMREGLGLRHILDWMLFVKNHVDDAFWYDQLEEWAKKGHVDVLARIMTRMCQKYLGLTRDITWTKDADETACDQLMEYVFQQGDFGAKAIKQDKEVRLLTESQRAGGFWKRLKRSSLYSMPAARSHKFLRPLAWVYQLFRYMAKGLHRNHPFRSFFQDKKAGKERADLFRKLGLRSE